MITIKAIWISTIVAAIAFMLVYRLVVAIRHNMMSDSFSRTLSRR